MTANRTPNRDWYIRWEPRAWLADPAVAACSLAAQGLWMRLLCHAWASNPRGVVAGDPRTVARLAGAAPDEVEPLITELLERGVCSRGPEVDLALPPDSLVSRRLYRDGAAQRQRQTAGRARARQASRQGGRFASADPSTTPPCSKSPKPCTSDPAPAEHQRPPSEPASGTTSGPTSEPASGKNITTSTIVTLSAQPQPATCQRGRQRDHQRTHQHSNSKSKNKNPLPSSPSRAYEGSSPARARESQPTRISDILDRMLPVNQRDEGRKDSVSDSKPEPKPHTEHLEEPI